MSVIQKIQQRQKWVFGAIALALILFIIQDRFFGSNSNSSLTGPGTSVGKINGESIEKSDFNFQEDLIKQNQQGAVDPDQLSAYVWNMTVSSTVLNQEFEKAGLAYTNKEFGEDIKGSTNPPQWFRQQFSDPQTGVYDGAKATDYIAQVNQSLKKNPSSQQAQMFKKAVLDPSQESQLATKYGSLIAGAVYIPKWMADKVAADNNSIASISYVAVPYSSVSDSAVKVTDEDINDYVKRHAKEFEQKDETRQIAYVTFDASPNANDTLSAYQKLDELKGQFAETKDPKSFVELNGSSMPYSGSYLSKSAIHQPVNDSLFKLQPGQIYGPYKDAGAWVMAKMLDEKILPDSVKVRHILVATVQQDQQTGQFQRVRDDSSAQKRLDSAVALIKAGVSFDSVCLKYSDDGTRTTGGVYNFFPTGKMVEEFNNFVFTGKKGDKQVVHTEYGFHYVEILDQKGSEPAYKIAYLSRPVTVSQETDAAAQNEANAFAGTSHNLKDFYENAAKLKKTPLTAGNIKENDFSIGSNNPRLPSQLGTNKQFVNWIYKNDVGDISPAQTFKEKYVVAIITAINKPGLPGPETTRPLVEAKVRNEKKAKLIADTKIKGATLDAIAQANNTSVQQADSIAFPSQFIRNLGAEPKVLGAAFNKNLQGKVSPAIAGEVGVYVIRGNSISGIPAQGNAEQQRTAAMLNLKSQELGAPQYGQQMPPPYLTALIKAAKIKDNRAKLGQ